MLRETEIRDIHREYARFYQMGGGVLIFVAGLWLGSFMQDGYLSSIYTEILSIIVIIAVLDRVIDWRARQRSTEELRIRLIREAGSRGHDTAVTAVDWLRAAGWLSGDSGVLAGADLHRANLEGAYLFDANLKKAYLFSANLQRSNLFTADLEDANLEDAQMQKAYLYNANLSKSNLFNADMENANLEGANLQHTYLGFTNLAGACLANADFTHATLSHVIFDRETILPDARIIRWDDRTTPIYDKYWTPSTDMSRYTDPKHPRYWQPEWSKEVLKHS